MQVYLKIHSRGDIEIVAACDDDLLNQELRENELRIKITGDFYGGSLVDIDHAIDVLSDCPSFNIIGKNIISKAINCGIVHKSSIRKINDVPMAIKMVL